MKDKLIVLLGPTAVGKTSLAVQLALKIKGEIISADSRQVYRGMDIGTGKDLGEYQLPSGPVNYHLIDIMDPGETYDVFRFQKEFYRSRNQILQKGKEVILCGGSGMYLEAALRKKQFLKVPKDEKLRSALGNLSIDELKYKLIELKEDVHNTTDLLDKDRLLRAIEIAYFEKANEPQDSPIQDYIIFGIRMEREKLRQRIKDRLDQRLEEGMIHEVKQLLESGVKAEKLDYYGLEYRYIVKYLTEELSYSDMYDQLLQSIRRFAKKQMTWYRRMEKQGFEIHWLESEWESNKKLDLILSKL